MLRPALTALLLSSAPALADVPRVATDIAPVHSLVAQVMGDLGQPDLLVRPGASPHGYSLRPSEARALDQADLVVIMGAQLTPWLSGPLETLATDAKQRSLLDVEGITLLTNRTGATFDAHDHDHDHDDKHDHGDDHGHDDHAHGDEHAHDKEHAHDDDHAHDHDDDHADEKAHMHDHDGDDPHAWLDPQNAALWLDVIADDLAALDPENAATYRANAAAARDRLKALQDEIAAAIPDKAGGFIVFHDAYQYFEARFGLAAAGAISLSDATTPSAGRLAELRERIADLNVSCVFTEPQFDPGIIAALDIEGLQTASLDPMGSSFDPGPEHYGQTLRAMGAAFAGCLAD